MGKSKRTLRTLILVPIWVYQRAISPYIGRHCRFYPSCSQYGREAVSQLGVLRGVRLLLWRLARCHPFSKGGFDPVPDNHRMKHKKR